MEKVLQHWELTPERVVAPGGRTSLALLVRRADGGPATLKLCAPQAPAALEYAALRRWDGWGAVRALECDADAGALLLERLHGEVSLRSLPETKAMLEAASAVRRLWVDPGADSPFPSVARRTGDQVARILRVRDAEPEIGPLVDAALQARDRLGADSESVLLHGDFRQGVVLASDAERAPWLAVGPDPVVGERAYDLARLARDRLHDLVASPGAPAITRRRIAKLAGSVDVDPERLRDWTLFRAVESGTRHLAAGNREDAEPLLEFAGWL